MTSEQITRLLADCEHLIDEKQRELRELQAAAGDLRRALERNQPTRPEREKGSERKNRYGYQESVPLSRNDADLRVSVRRR